MFLGGDYVLLRVLFVMKIPYKKEIRVSNYTNLVVSLFVVGYPCQGESIVILFRDGEQVVFSMVVDCFEYKGLNKTREILEKYNVEKLDAICWTHPHCDHSLGIDKLVVDYYKKETVFFLPSFYFGNLSEDLLNKDKESEKTPEIFDSIHAFLESKKNMQENWWSISANGNTSKQYQMKLVSENVQESAKDVCLYFLTPLGYRTDQYAVRGKKFSKPNELSVSFVLSIDDYDFFLGADTENEHAEGICDDVVKSFRWVKVPHHCSTGGRSIAERLGPKLDYSASTIFSKKGLPEEDIQKIYAERSTLHMTQLVDSDSYDFGIVQYDYHFGSLDIGVDMTLYGNAGEFIYQKETDSI